MFPLFILGPFLPLVLPREAWSILNQSQNTYATIVSGRQAISQVKGSFRKLFDSVLPARDDFSIF